MAQVSLLYGDSGSYKTTAVGHAIRYTYEATGKKSRLVTVEPGWATIRDLRDAGLVDVFSIAAYINPLPLIRKLSEGYWPVHLDAEGVSVDGVLAPATDETWKGVGLVAFEGLTSASERLMRDQTEKGRTIKGDGIGEYVEAVTILDASGKPIKDVQKFAYNTQGHYGFVQKEMLARTVSFGALGVERVIITAHEAKGEEEDTRRAIRGPALAGQKGTDKVLKYVGDALHFEVYQEDRSRKDVDGKEVRTSETKVRVFFQNHPDPTWAGSGTPVFYKCKPRMPPAGIAKLKEKWPGGFFTVSLEHGLDEYFRLQDEFTKLGAWAVSEWKKGVDERRGGK